MSHEEKGRNQGETSRCQKAAKISANHEELGEKLGTDVPSHPSEGTNARHTLILDLRPPELGDGIFLLFKPPSLSYFVLAAQAKK